jgi:malonate-semialdehyde dehydrogenase (acetylating) / methylmalonate-semialdehyde dehydrogenase
MLPNQEMNQMIGQMSETRNILAIPMIINGKRIQSQSRQGCDVVDPATQEKLARVPFSTLDELEAAVAAAKEAFWAGSEHLCFPG